MVPLIKEEVVSIRNWMALTDFVDVLAIGNALPGPIATKMSVVIGYDVGGALGALAALAGTVMPSVIVLILLLRFVAMISGNPRVTSVLRGLRPVVVALLAFAAYDMSFGSITGIATVLIGAAALLLMIFTKIHPALFIVAGAVAGALLGL